MFKSIFNRNNYQKRLKINIKTTGNELKGNEIISFSKQIALNELFSYFTDVYLESNEFINNLEFQDLKTKILIVLESEYKYLEISQNNIIYSNNEMKRLMPDDKDIIESISINEKFFKKNLERMIQIKKRISLLEGNNHYICKKALPSLPK